MGKIRPGVEWAELARLFAIDAAIASRTLLAVLGPSSFGLAILDRHLRYVGVNPALAAMNGLPAPEHSGKEISDVLGKATPKVASLVERVFETRQPIKGVKVSAKLPLRPTMAHWIEDYLPLADSKGKVTKVVALIAEVNQWWQEFGGDHDSSCSPRETEIVRLLADGKSNKQVSSLLDISVKTVEAHRARVMLKLDLNSLVGLVHYAIRNRLVEP